MKIRELIDTCNDNTWAFDIRDNVRHTRFIISGSECADRDLAPKWVRPVLDDLLNSEVECWHPSDEGTIAVYYEGEEVGEA